MAYVFALYEFFKQRNLLFYPAWAYALPSFVLKILVSIVECVWTAMTYYVVGFDPNAERMFRQYLLFTLLSQMALGLFRLLAALGREMVTANTYGSLAQLILLSLGGFALSQNNIKRWWIWGYWSSPFMLLIERYVRTLGVQVLKSRGLFTESYWFWIGVGALFGYIFLLNVHFALTVTYINPIGKAQTVLSQEALIEKHVNRTGEYVEPSSKGNNSGCCFSFKGKGDISTAKNKEDSNQKKKRGMILPFSPLCITFEDIKYSIDMPNEMKAQGITQDSLLLLNGLTGAFRPGVLTALMGVSGAGKTTLMDVLDGRKTGGHIEGRIKISGYPKKQETFARISGYCEQSDIHSPHVTVYESLLYSAWLRLSPEVDSSTRKWFTERCKMAMFEALEKVKGGKNQEDIFFLVDVLGFLKYLL